MTEPLILVVEDEEKLAGLLKDYLVSSGYRCHCIHHGDDVLPWLKSESADAILLDLMLPGKDGLTLCREIRAFSQVPILMVTARVDEIDRLLGLEMGADDYICKPFSPREVVARVKAVLRRAQRQPIEEKGLNLDQRTLVVSFEGRSAELTAVECQLLRQLMGEPGRIFSREQLMNSMYEDYRVVSDRTIDSHIRKIRRKLDGLDAAREFIHSVYGVGYRYETVIKEASE